jgi:hypothetical protein
MGKKSVAGIWDEHLRLFSESLETVFRVKNPDPDPF